MPSEDKELKKAGLRVTLPRLKILQILEARLDDHLSAEDIYQELRDAGDDVGIATGSLYRHFRSKGELAAEVFASASQREVDALAAALRGPGSASERLRIGLEQFAARAWHSRRLAFALIAEPVDPEVDERRLLYREAYAELFVDLLEEGGRVVQETRLYNGDSKVARSMRSKEEANDYRYFPCPDLLPVVLSEETVARLRSSLPELPDARIARLAEQFSLSGYDAAQLHEALRLAVFSTANFFTLRGS